MLCISRITEDAYAQNFGNNRNKFYLEFRCGRPCISGLNVCAKCCEKSTGGALQHSRKFNHGKVNEPIPDESHIFGGKWYYEGVKKWGAPPSEIIEFALQYQKEARGDFIVVQPSYDESSKAKTLIINQEMPRPKKITTVSTETSTAVSEAPKKRTRKPKVAGEEVPVTTDAPKKRTRKPKVAPDAVVSTTEIVDETAPKPKKTTGRKKPQPSPYAALVASTPQLVHKEVALPTHLEETMEEFDAEGYEIEYIKLVPFEVGGTTYFRDSKKNKLYKKMKDKIGEYVGRFNPDNDTIVSDVPDSDDEN